MQNLQVWNPQHYDPSHQASWVQLPVIVLPDAIPLLAEHGLDLMTDDLPLFRMVDFLVSSGSCDFPLAFCFSKDFVSTDFISF